MYHLRAARYRSTLWAPFRAHIASWLATCLPYRGQELLLLGPSAGHCLPEAWLKTYPRVTVIEPDPLARALLRLRLSARVEVEHRDLLLAPLLSGRTTLAAVLERRPHATVLFCNMLGQLHFTLSDDEHARFQAEFARCIVPALEGHAWASFHDRWSLDTASIAPPSSLTFAAQPSDDELGARWFGADGPPVTVLDHGTTGLFPAALPRRYFGWQITPRALHIVEAVAAQLGSASNGTTSLEAKLGMAARTLSSI